MLFSAKILSKFEHSMSSAVNNNGFDPNETSTSTHDTDPFNPEDLQNIINVIESPQYQNFINMLDAIPEDNVKDNINAYTLAVEGLIKDQFIDLFKKVLPAEAGFLKKINDDLGGKLFANLQKIIEGHDGITQLAAVIISMTLDQNKNFFKKVDVFEIICSLAVQHLTEIISDNLNEHGLLSENILKQFVNVIDASEEDLHIALRQALNVFETELIGQKIGAVFNITNQHVLDAIIDKFLDDNTKALIVPKLLYLNLVASRKERDVLAKHASSPISILKHMAIHGIQRLDDRYISQIELRRQDLTEEQLMEVRTKEILTGNTYSAIFLAKCLGDSTFLKIMSDLEISEIFRNIENAGIVIRIANDLGGLMLKDYRVVLDKFLRLSTQANKNEPQSLSETKTAFLNLLLSQDQQTQKLFYAYIKDLKTNEPNSALDLHELQFTELKTYIESLYIRTEHLSILAHNTFNRIRAVHPLLQSFLIPFIEVCALFYDEAVDFDSANARRPVMHILNKINSEEPDSLIFQQPKVSTEG